MATRRQTQGSRGPESDLGDSGPRPHYLSQNHGTRIPQTVIYFDVQSVPHYDPKTRERVERFAHVAAVRLCRERGEWTRRQEFAADEPAAFWAWIAGQEHARKPLWLIGYNAGFGLTLLDFWALLDTGVYSLSKQFNYSNGGEDEPESKDGKWVGTAVTGDPPTVLCVRSARGTIRIVDTQNYIDLTPRTMAGGSAVRDVPVDGRDEGALDRSGEQAKELTAVEMTFSALLDRWERQDCGVWKTTAAGLAWSAFRHVCPPRSIVIDHTEPHTSLARESYYGGQCEAFYVGPVVPAGGGPDNPELASLASPLARPRGPVYMVDVRAFYPFCMAANPFPVKFHRYWPECSLDRLVLQAKAWLPIASALIESPNLPYPVRRDGVVNYRTGNFWTVLPGPELLAAVEMGHCREVRRVAWYLAGRPFAAHMGTWWEQRAAAELAGDGATAALSKMVMNALYGKLAQQRIRWGERPGRSALQRWGEWSEIDSATKVVTEFRGLAGHVQEKSRGGEGREAAVQISSFVTSYGRLYMQRIREQLPPRSYLYQDTDSLIVTSAGLHALMDKFTLGESRMGGLCVKWASQRAQIFGPKDYAHDGGRVCAGMKPDAEWIAPDVYRQSRKERLNEVVTRSPRAEIHVTPVVVNMRHETSVRAIGPDGWTTPLELHDEKLVPF